MKQNFKSFLIVCGLFTLTILFVGLVSNNAQSSRSLDAMGRMFFSETDGQLHLHLLKEVDNPKQMVDCIYDGLDGDLIKIGGSNILAVTQVEIDQHRHLCNEIRGLYNN